MRVANWLVGSMLGVALVGGALTATAAEPRASGQLLDRAGVAVGRVEMEQAGAETRLTVEASGLTPGRHGIHVHAVGRCDGPAFTTAGGHFNPAGKKHGLKSPEGAHGGDLPNLEADAAGRARFTTTSTLFSLSPGAASVFDADGAALVIHAGPDDETTDPTGNSGDRVACAVVRLVAPSMPNTGAGGLSPDLTLVLAGGGVLALAGLEARRWRHAAR